MKMPFKKSIYRDVFERTRGLRIGFFLFSVALTCLGNSIAERELYAPEHARLPIWPMVLLTVSFAFFQELRVHAYHRKKKWQWFYTVPFNKGEWYWTTRAAEATNLLILIVVMSIEEYIACLILMKRLKLSQIGMPFIRQAVFAFAAGLLFMALLSMVRELTHSIVAFVGLLFMTLLTLYISLEMIEETTVLFTKGFGDLPVYWPTRFCLIGRTFMELDLEVLDNIALVYDTLAILAAILISVPLMLLGRKLADTSRAEYVGAENRNKKLFVVFVSISLLLSFHILALIIKDSELNAYILLFVVLFALIIYLFCRLLKERSIRRVGRCFLIAVVAFAVLTGISGLASLFGLRIPAEDRVVGVEQDGYIFTDRAAVSKAYKEIVAEKKRRADGGERAGKTISYILFTKCGSLSYEVPDTTENGLIIKTVLESGPDYESSTIEFPYEPNKAVIEYGYKPVLTGDLETKDYERILERIPEAYKKEIPVYRVNFFGGLSLSKETAVTYPDVIPEGSGYLVGMYLENQFRHCDGNMMFLFPADTEVMCYYVEEIQAEKWKDIAALIKSANRTEIRLSFPPKEEDSEDPLWRFRGTRSLQSICLNGRSAVCSGFVHGYGLKNNVKLPQEANEEVENLLSFSGEVTFEGGEYVLAECYVICYFMRDVDWYDQEIKTILLALPKDKVERIFDRVKEGIPEVTE